MKNFFSQTWVVALLVAVVLGVVVYVAYKQYKDKEETPAVEEGAAEGK